MISYFELEVDSSNLLTTKTFSCVPTLFSLAVTIDTRTLVFEHVVANHNKLIRPEVNATVARQLFVRSFEHMVSCELCFFSVMEGYLQIDVSCCVLLSVNNIYIF